MRKKLSDYLPYLAMAISFALGAFGYAAYFRQNQVAHDFTDLVFVTIRLFIMETDYTVLPLNPALDVARYIAPLSLAGTVVSVVLRFFSSSADRLRMRRLSGHVVVCGDGPDARAIFQDAKSGGGRAVFLRKVEGPEAEGAHERGVLPFEDLTPQVARDAALRDCDRLFFAFQDDAEALSFAARLAGILGKGRRDRALDVVLAFKSPEWMGLAEGLGLLEALRGGDGKLRYRYLCGLGRAVRRLMTLYPPDSFRPISSRDDGPQAVCVFGSGACARELLLRYALGAHYVNAKRSIAYVVARRDKDALRDFITRRQLGLIIDVREVDPDRLDGIDVAPAALYFCEDGLFDRLDAYRAAAAAPGLAPVPKVLVKLEAGDLVNRLEGGPTRVFDLTAETTRVSSLVDESADLLARAIHEDYLAELGAARPLDPRKPTHRPWELLPDEIRERNRLQADGIMTKARSLGCEVLPEAELRARDEVVESLEGEPLLEALSEAEHNRWCAVMYAAGWKRGAERDDARKLHTDLVPYDELDEGVKQYDRNAVLNVPKLLGRIGQKLVRRS